MLPLTLAITEYVFAIIAIGFLIFVHELGHFLACKATKTRVETFSIGFGPRLFGWETPKGGQRRFTVGRRQLSPQAHAMDVRIAAIPLGGYVKMAGEIGGDATPGDPRALEGRPPEPDEFPGKPFASRLLIITAGVIMNALTAFVLLVVVYAIGLREPEPVIGGVEPGGPAWSAGIEPGDRVVSLGGSPIRTFLDIRGETPLLRSGGAEIEIERAGVRRRLAVRPEASSEHGILQLLIQDSFAWTIGEGENRLVIGSAEPALVAGRRVVGGREAESAAREAARLGISPIRVSRADGTGSVVDVAATRADGPKAKRIGVLAHQSATVERVREGSPAAAAGLRAGDRLAAVDGEPVDRVARLLFRPSIGALDVRRDGETKTLTVGAADPAAVAAFWRGVALADPTRAVVDVDEAFPGGSPAGAAGVRSGDLILAVNGEPVADFPGLLAAIAAAVNEPMRLRVQTGDEVPRELTVVAREVPSAEPPIAGTIEQPKTTVGGTGFGDAVALGATRTKREFVNLFRMIRSFFTGDIRVDKGVGGPGTLIYISSKSYNEGVAFFLLFLAVISVNLAVLNILPIPVLDGGQLLFLVVEKLRGRPLREATIAKAQLVGLFLLLALMFFALRNDFRLLG